MTLEMKIREVRDEAMEIGEARGLKIGEAKGKTQGKEELIRTIFSNGQSPKEIAKLVNMTEEEIIRILNQE